MIVRSVLWYITTSALCFVPNKTRFVLIDTRHEGNVGAAARAIKTMGFEDLVLVTPKDPKVLNRQKTIHGASGALDILENSKVCSTLEEALEGIDHWCATAMPNDMNRERPKWNFSAPRNHFENILSNRKKFPLDEMTLENESSAQEKEATSPKESDTSNIEIRIAFLFGNERYGMQDEDIRKCHAVLGIPTNPKFGSLNVASAVQLIAYDWREAIGGYKV
mmetsp:Transcript_15946/g.19150  ORF Transcript_15946/g.19150 Transcript_15946/m.19150 type:complete len:221 (-) Transcript_15946:59-721(-)|eukprot:CAMPEP_0195295348 /NCGR_PEP_ID=MMETSP0707-20130614/17171_1 /TAXON_ID=33640 /ORGANISM="Asterionellopsis glacialis, Strain CCMP134" /LENGTH=220 /DNA_ID=CAMNT_0040356553 /DNA_START=98 /DNA_END=760 /DNA_ORIENTATION=+